MVNTGRPKILTAKYIEKLESLKINPNELNSQVVGRLVDDAIRFNSIRYDLSKQEDEFYRKAISKLLFKANKYDELMDKIEEKKKQKAEEEKQKQKQKIEEEQKQLENQNKLIESKDIKNESE